MDGTPHLLTDVKFSERRKGYDPDEVDNFLERVSGAVAQLQDKLRQATSRAEEADAKVADAKRAQAVAEAQVDKLKADLSKAGSAPKTAESGEAVDPEVSADAATNILVMAQKTAEGTVDEAKHMATKAIADARAKSAGLVADAERERDKLLAEAEVKAQALLDERAARVHAEAAKLEQLREELQADVDALRAYLDTHREALRERVQALEKVLDDPESLRLPESPGLSAATVGGIDLDTGDDPAPVAPTPDATEEQDTTVAKDEPLPEPATDEPAAEDEPTSPVDGATKTSTEATSPPAHTAAKVTDDPAPIPDPEPSAESAAPAAPPDPEAGFPPVKVPELFEPERSAQSVFDAEKSDIDLTTERLFGNSAEASAPKTEDTAGGAPTALFSPFPATMAPPDADSEFGVPDADADEAMRAFFEADFTEEPKEAKGPRFGRKR